MLCFFKRGSQLAGPSGQPSASGLFLAQSLIVQTRLSHFRAIKHLWTISYGFGISWNLVVRRFITNRIVFLPYSLWRPRFVIATTLSQVTQAVIIMMTPGADCHYKVVVMTILGRHLKRPDIHRINKCMSWCAACRWYATVDCVRIPRPEPMEVLLGLRCSQPRLPGSHLLLRIREVDTRECNPVLPGPPWGQQGP